MTKSLINIAFEEYWLKGFNNVTLSSIANIAKISRPGIYKEFKDEDGLKCEALKKYTNAQTYKTRAVNVNIRPRLCKGVALITR